MIEVERALAFELSKIPELNDKIYPTNAPEGEKAPYLTYILSSYEQLRTLDAILDDTEKSYMLNILCASYEQMKELTEAVKEKAYGFIGNCIGQAPVYVENVVINNMSETYEDELKLYRGILDITIFY